MKRIAILVNKDFEYTGFIEGLRDTVQVYAGTNRRDAECRFDNLIADIYCIQNLFGKYKYGKHDSPDNASKNSSNSEMKYGYLKDLFKSNAFRLEDLDGMLSFSSAESTPKSQGTDKYESSNGSVFVGGNFYLSDQSKNDSTTKSHLTIGDDKTCSEFYHENPLCDRLYDFLDITKMSLKDAFINPSVVMCHRGGYSFTNVSVVNVMDYSCYRNADEEAYNQFIKSYEMKDNLGVSIETTHGVVVKALHDAIDEWPDKENEIPKKIDVPVNFISPIVDRYLRFDEDVDGKYGKQNFVCSYNGGVVTGHMMKILNENM